MLERIILAAVVTFCIYLFLNLGNKSSQPPSLDAQDSLTPSFLGQTTLLGL